MKDVMLQSVTCIACGRENDGTKQFCIECGKWLNNVQSSVVSTDSNNLSDKWVVSMPLAGLLIGTFIGLVCGLGIYVVFPMTLFTVIGSIIGLVIIPFIYRKEKELSLENIVGALICSIILIVVFLAIKYKDHW